MPSNQTSLPLSLDYVNVNSCRVCGHSDLRRWLSRCPDRSETVDRTFTYERCASCRAVNLTDGPVERDVGAFYPADYAPYVPTVSANFPMFSDESTRDPLTLALRASYAPPREGARLLDFGCGSPALLGSAREHGWVTAGADFATSTVDSVAQQGHEAWESERLLVAKADEVEPFDLIRLNHVVEHLYDPRRVLAHLLTLLRPSGVLHLATPNPDGVSSMLFRRAWFSLEAPRHLVLFPPATLLSLVTEIGYTGARLYHEPVTKDFARSASYACQDLLRRRAAGPTGNGPRTLNRAAQPLFRVAEGLGRADRYHVLATAPA